jgi:hypothetical protein
MQQQRINSMGFKADRAISPTSKLIMIYLTERTALQSVISISDAVGASYWTTRILCKELADAGLLNLTLVGKSPHYAVAIASEAK